VTSDAGGIAASGSSASPATR